MNISPSSFKVPYDSWHVDRHVSQIPVFSDIKNQNIKMMDQALKVDIYKYPYRVVVGNRDDIKAFREEHTDTDKTPIDKGDDMLTIWSLTHDMYCIIIHDDLSEIYDDAHVYGMIAHEASHMAMLCAESRDISLDITNMEPVGYLIEDITTKAIRIYHQYIKDK